MTKILFFLKRAFQAAYFEVSMVKIGPQTIGGIYQSLSPIKNAESESHDASSMRYQNTDLCSDRLCRRSCFGSLLF